MGPLGQGRQFDLLAVGGQFRQGFRSLLRADLGDLGLDGRVGAEGFALLFRGRLEGSGDLFDRHALQFRQGRGEFADVLLAFAASAQMGSTRLLRLCPIACPADAARAREIAANALAPDAAQLASLPPAPRMIGLGGACTTAAAIQSGREMHGDAVEGMTVTRAEAERQLAALSAMTLEERMRVPGLPPTRAAHMPHGLCILLSVMALCGHDALTVSGKTNLDGYLTA